MSRTALEAILAFFAATSASLVTLLVARRNTSGNVNTSDARLVFEEGRDVRKAITVELAQARSDLRRIEAALEACNRKVEILTKVIGEKSEEIDQLHEDARRFRIDNALLRKQLAEARGEADA